MFTRILDDKLSFHMSLRSQRSLRASGQVLLAEANSSPGEETASPPRAAARRDIFFLVNTLVSVLRGFRQPEARDRFPRVRDRSRSPHSTRFQTRRISQRIHYGRGVGVPMIAISAVLLSISMTSYDHLVLVLLITRKYRGFSV